MAVVVVAAVVEIDLAHGPDLAGRGIAGWSVCASVCPLLTRSRVV